MKIEGYMHPTDKRLLEAQNATIKSCLQVIENQRIQIESLKRLLNGQM